ncbi:GntG family PLP-dependent aldolase [Oceaniglobus trochenteri]|uniref:GntG family PLP-dependent aldolase n=1 Tax=Oceaniglobus trochenteri TaxID=2763260 RepID=UPI001CFF72BC|nr:GntG family PLP-dependent aldolase [Oceaniglobus trochenteri]
MTDIIDLRSDTVTRPTPEMRAAMARADVGDDGYRDDPTVAALESLAADITGKAAALLVLSGTMGNLVAVMTQLRNGDAALIEEQSHIYRLESGHLSSICGITPRPFAWSERPEHTAFANEDVFESALNHPRANLLCLENTHNIAGGRCMSATTTARLADAAHARGMVVHMDGARIFNAAESLGESVASLCAPCDTVTFCLSKGLGAPVGSMLCGPADTIDAARRYRQMVGGGMRQAGVFAAAGIVALQSGTAHLAADHAHARQLAQMLHEGGLDIDPASVETNIVYVRIPKGARAAQDLRTRLADAAIRVNPPKGDRLRFVFHRDISPAMAQQAIARIRPLI